MRLFIQILNGQPHQHPIIEDNFREAFPHIDVDNLPSNFAEFIRVSRPYPGANTRLFLIDRVSYQWVGNQVQDVWVEDLMTDSEKEIALTERVKVLENVLAQCKNIAHKHIASETGEGLQVWETYLQTLIDFKYEKANSFNTFVPPIPIKNSEDEWVHTTSSGSAPNVIG
jgi:hypothetical protein